MPNRLFRLLEERVDVVFMLVVCEIMCQKDVDVCIYDE